MKTYWDQLAPLASEGRLTLLGLSEHVVRAFSKNLELKTYKDDNPMWTTVGRMAFVPVRPQLALFIAQSAALADKTSCSASSSFDRPSRPTLWRRHGWPTRAVLTFRATLPSKVSVGDCPKSCLRREGSSAHLSSLLYVFNVPFSFRQATSSSHVATTRVSSNRFSSTLQVRSLLSFNTPVSEVLTIAPFSHPRLPFSRRTQRMPPPGGTSSTKILASTSPCLTMAPTLHRSAFIS